MTSIDETGRAFSAYPFRWCIASAVFSRLNQKDRILLKKVMREGRTSGSGLILKRQLMNGGQDHRVLQCVKGFDGMSDAGSGRRYCRFFREYQLVWGNVQLAVAAFLIGRALKAGGLDAGFRLGVKRGCFYHQSVSQHRDHEKERYLENAENVSADGRLSGMHKLVV